MNESSLLSSLNTGLFVGGEWREGSDGKQIDVEDPATGKVLTSIADATVEDGVAALDAAVAVQAEWAATPPRERAELLRSAFELINERADELALLMTLEMGKPLAQSKGEVTYGNEFFRWFSEEVVRIHGRYSVSPDGSSRLLTMKQPVGPTLMITPWNFPLAMGTRKIGPAIAAGCTMVVKPASQTPLTMLRLAQVLEEVGVPKGVLNVVPTSRTGDVMGRLISDPRLRKLTFTGSTGVGKKLVEQSAEQLLRVSMELGGNAPFLVFPDADLDKAVDGAMLAKMRNMGEACTAANRFLVHEDVADEFARRFGERMAAEKVGRGTDEGVTVGPLIDQKAKDKVSELVDDATSRGASVVTGGRATGEAGYFYEPTVLTDVPADADLVHEEIFGPVAPITTFSDEDKALRLANDTEYGLVAYVFTTDLGRMIRVSEGLQSGMVAVNQGIISNAAAPFGGVKHSGFGREGGFEGIEEYLSVKYVGIAP
ncbi:NAD-dependent succinate-semialdehyde dehydrogenase [Nocardioides marmoribigeumensis]|uniref:Succinate-semialdehyde dehydrogenase/glutarate-semialdehyde dehydrogenase n=1 Tax=Nocardioides marmoribigeumensis TaxID=433649 RepID=A0ABU2BWH3_9ACTN|nr:NAD-dependent succinate-semialdehyde dehydrogenase [Nocardioides marmoribigeumensis]MDR7362444.1 succinate-semialdehyde dehydrogenase/glutarate-semialdehyde dehydrogenase [Nocardioides marmoribigeumensis]